MSYGILKAPKNLVINLQPSPKQYELWKLLQPDFCPHCGGQIEQVLIGYDAKGNAQYKPQCNVCHSQDLPQLILGGGPLVVVNHTWGVVGLLVAVSDLTIFVRLSLVRQSSH